MSKVNRISVAALALCGALLPAANRAAEASLLVDGSFDN